MRVSAVRVVAAVCAAATLASVAGAGVGAFASGARARTCFGAAARDPARPCFNPSIAVIPPVAKVDDSPGSPCDLTQQQPEPVCTFGTSAARATATIALVGDSHALHWRAALDVVARHNRWRGYSITAPGCSYSEAVNAFPEGLRQACVDWYREAQRWFADHPQVSTVFVSVNATTPIVVQPGQIYLGVKSAGFRRAWSALPGNVRHVVVIHDTPDPADDTLDCVKAAIAAGRRAGPACATPRVAAIHWDTAVATVHQIHSPRYQA
ncbi:MAG: hypothetical protein QOE11_584, partial [Solirubrobacteraceae bacterium]|nr:hypothetical protein [Solirubrobacteraceae bacterium]